MTTTTRKFHLVQLVRPIAFATALTSAAIAGASGSILNAAISVLALTLILEGSSRPSAQ